MAIHLTPEANPTVQEGTLYVDSATGEFNVAGRTTPHIIPGVLYPAVSGNDINGTALGGSYTYGTAHTDGRKYYYTDIKGSKPIKDPRIGGHFGSQRYRITSQQILEQETATHGKEVVSFDGREFFRGVATGGIANDSKGMTPQMSENSFFEITGYFSQANLLLYTYGYTRSMTVSLDGVTAHSAFQSNASVDTPLRGRYVHASHVINIPLTASGSSLSSDVTLGIHTLKIFGNVGQGAHYPCGFELIAQDTSNRNNIQIPSQNVVSYGKKFTVSGTPHYDPFSAKTDGSAWTSPTSGTNNANSSASWPTNIDTATSLGLDKWVDGSNYYRPYNGGRVVKWVDSSGTIKTSVTVMPPNAKSVKSADVNKKAKNAPNDTYLPTFEDETTDVNEDNLHELAKSFHFREFGNGSANGGTGATNYADASMLNTTDDIAYVMDDGLSSLVGHDAAMQTGPIMGVAGTDDSESYITFIGTGIGYHAPSASGSYNSLDNDVVAQNLPYGSHIIRNGRKGGGTLNNVDVDGVEVYDDNSAIQGLEYINIFQPKKPPIPEDACVIADYMLMADYVAQSSGTAPFISKGVRRNNSSRDLFYETSASTLTFNLNVTHAGGFQLGVSGSQSADVFQGNLPAFATRIDSVGYGDRRQIYVDGGSAETQTVSGSAADAVAKMSNAQALGSYTFKSKNKASTDGTISAIDVVTPIHTSHHYQSFETPFLHELVGGDRNMEQTNLVVSPDGKTWDELTRDTSYIGNIVLAANEDSAVNADVNVVFKDRRGSEYGYRNYFNKDFAIGYDRDICLKDGWYHINLRTASKGGGAVIHGYIRINSSGQLYSYPTDSGTSQNTGLSIFLKRGDLIEIRGNWNGDGQYNNYEITRLK